MPVRDATEADLPRIVELWTAMWKDEEERDERFASSPVAPKIQEAWISSNLGSDRARLLVHEEGGAVQAYALAILLENPPIVTSPLFGYLAELCVDPDARRTGHGRRLTEACHEWFKARGCSHAEVNVSVKNDAGRAFYGRLGYRPFLERLRVEL